MLNLFSLRINAQEEKVYTVPIAWQKVELQKQIMEDVTRSVGAIVDKSNFLIHVSIKLSKAKTFGAGLGKGKKGDKSFGLEKLGLNKNSSAYKKAISVGGDSVFSRIKNIQVDVSLDRKVTRGQETQVREFVDRVVTSVAGRRPSLKVKRIAFLTDALARSRNLELAQVNVEAAKTVAEAMTKSNTLIADAINAMQGRETPKLDEKKDEDKTVHQSTLHGNIRGSKYYNLIEEEEKCY